MAIVRNKLVVNQNDVSTAITELKGRAEWAALQTGANNPVGAVFAMQATWNGDDWYACKMTDPNDPVGAAIADITGANKAGYARVVGASGVRAKRTDGTVGNGDVSVMVFERNP